jgi:hypothetical protein
VFDAAEIVEPIYKATCGDNRDGTVVTFAPRKEWKQAQEKAEFLREQLRPVLLDDAKAAEKCPPAA